MRWTQDKAFVVGTNLPWLSYGGDFGANRWHAQGGVGRPDRIPALRDLLARLADEGFTHVRWFMLCDGRAGLRPGADGEPAGLDAFVFRDVDAAAEAIARAGLRAIFVVFDFHWFLPAVVVDGVQTRGRGDVATGPGPRARLLERVVAPILDRYGRHPSIAAWDVLNEPEWVTRGSARPAADILDAARRAGYAGALAWSALSGDSESDSDAMASALRAFAAAPPGLASRA